MIDTLPNVPAPTDPKYVYGNDKNKLSGYIFQFAVYFKLRWRRNPCLALDILEKPL
jgi:hypothetical protein